LDFNDSPPEAAFRAEARAFLDAQGTPDLPHYGDDSVAPGEALKAHRAWQQVLHGAGWASITLPQSAGGRGLGPIEQIIWNQELARFGAGESLFAVGIGMAAPTILAHADEATQARHIPKILSGEEVWCQMFSEPGAGSDLAALATRAEQDDSGDWIVNGQKTWCSGGHYADWGILIARTDPTVPKHEGITYFLLDMKTPGIEVRPLQDMTGATHFNEVFLSDVRIPDSRRLGPVGGGWKVTMTTLMNERMAMGGLDRLFSLDDLLQLARDNPSRVDAVLRNQLGQLCGWMKSLELLNASVITKLGRGVMPEAESSVMKLAIARVLSASADIALRLLGPEAMERRGFWQNQYLLSPCFHIAGGTDEIQKNVAAERVLKLPAEPRPDREVPFESLARA
jgi:acyl-CoA dehydrogenase